MAIDIDAYFRRIGYEGSRSATLDTLRALTFHHTLAIPFENLNPIMRWPVSLDIDAIERKLVRDGRGGYCFEQNLLFGSVLESLGFRFKRLAGRTVWGRPIDAEAAQLHNLILVDVDGDDYAVDVGFGIATLTAPLRLELDIEQPTPHEVCRIIRVGDEYAVQVRIGDDWRALYRFDLQARSLRDFRVSNWFTSTNPNAMMVCDLMAARADPDRRHALRNNAYAVYHLSGETECRMLNSVHELRATLEGPFRIRLPESEDLNKALERFVDQPG